MELQRQEKKEIGSIGAEKREKVRRQIQWIKKKKKKPVN